MGGLSGEAVAAWVEASCADQGVPVKVTDPAALRRVSVLLGGRAATGAPAPVRPADSEPPHGHDPGGVEPAAAGGLGVDHCVVE